MMKQLFSRGMFRKWIAACALVASFVPSTGAWAQNFASPPQVTVSTSAGDFVIELFPGAAPVTVNNFIRYVQDGFYDNTIFTRNMGGEILQGGGFTTNFSLKRTREPIVNEARAALEKGARNAFGTVAMARDAEPNSAAAEFFINLKNNPQLDPQGSSFRIPFFGSKSGEEEGYTVFGRVIRGMEVIDRIKNMRTGAAGPFPQEVPSPMVVIRRASLMGSESMMGSAPLPQQSMSPAMSNGPLEVSMAETAALANTQKTSSSSKSRKSQRALPQAMPMAQEPVAMNQTFAADIPPPVAEMPPPVRNSGKGRTGAMASNSEIEDAIGVWAQSWANKDLANYFGAYSSSFRPDSGSRQQWESNRSARISGKDTIDLDLGPISVTPAGNGEMLAKFKQDFRSGNISSSDFKTLRFANENGRWLITRESVR